MKPTMSISYGLHKGPSLYIHLEGSAICVKGGALLENMCMPGGMIHPLRLFVDVFFYG